MSALTNTGPVAGSPSAAIVDGKVQIYARTPESGMRRFIFDTTWTFTDQPGEYADSPTATPGGIFARSVAGSLTFSDGQKWTVLGGAID